MPLSHELISQFVKVTNDKKTETRKETTAYGTVVTQNNIKYVKLDGSDELTPVNTNVVIHENDRVMVLIKNHTATVTGNESRKANQSSRKNDNNEYITLDDLAEGQVTRAEFDELVVAHLEVQGKLEAEDGIIKTLESNSAYIKELSSDKGIIASLRAEDVKINEKLKANTAYIETLSAEDGIIANLQAKDVEIERNLTSHIADFDILDADVAEFKIATADNFTSVNAKIEKLETDSLTSTNASITYAKIDFSNIGEAAIEKLFSDSGIVKELVMSEGHVTGSLQGVTINGDLIEANTLRTNKLVVKGTDGNYYSLNVNFDGIEGVTVASDDQIHGSALVADSVTANKIRVDDLVAFGATVGGFQLTENSIYSGSKGSASSDIPGLYFDSDGQMAVGDGSKYIKFYDDNGVKKLSISADSIKLGTESVAKTSDIDNLEIGGRNLLKDSESKHFNEYLNPVVNYETPVTIDEWGATNATRIYGNGGEHPLFAYMGIGKSISGQKYTVSIYAKNNHPTNIIWVVSNAGGFKEAVAPGESKRVVLHCLGNGNTNIQINLHTDVAGDEFDVTYWHPKIEFGDKATAWTKAPEDVDADIDDLNNKVTQAETAITQSSEAIKLRATKIEVSDAVAAVQVGGRNLITDTSDEWNEISVATYAGTVRSRKHCSEYGLKVGDTITYSLELDPLIKSGLMARLDFYSSASTEDGKTSVRGNVITKGDAGLSTITTVIPEGKEYIWLAVGNKNSTDETGSTAEHYRKAKLEKGNKATDWTPALEDMATGKELSNVSGEINDATERITVAESLITQLSTTISMLVTDENSMSLMTQTDDGWTFSTAQIQDAISDMSANLSTLTDTMGDVGMTIDVLSQAVADLGEIAEYVYITTYEDEPCIELGEGDSEFKLRITNTRMMFTEGSTVLAYFNNQSLHAKKVVIEEELQQGGFVRTTRSNGHLSLVWKGVES